MFPYWLLYGFCAAGALQYNARFGRTGRRDPILTFAAVAIMLMIGLRYEVGGDWENYEHMYLAYSYLDFESAMAFGDPAYTALNVAAAYFDLDIWAVNLVCAIIFTWGLVRFAKTQFNPWLALVIAVPYLIIVVAMGYTRQAVAIGLIMAGLAQLNQQTVGRFALYVLAAATFHKSAIVVLPFVGLAATRNRLAVVGLLIATGVLLYYFFVRASLDVMLTNYVDENLESQGAAIRVAMNVPPAIALLTLQKRLGFEEVQRRVWVNFSLAALLMAAILYFFELSTVVDRIALYLIPLQIAVLSRLPNALARDRASGFVLGGILVYSAAIQFVWLTFATHAEKWLPYQLIPLG